MEANIHYRDEKNPPLSQLNLIHIFKQCLLTARSPKGSVSFHLLQISCILIIRVRKFKINFFARMSHRILD
jgi:hypothetical protein